MFKVFYNITADEFIMHSLSLGKPIDVSLIGAFENSGRASKRDVEIDFHRDGDYTTEFKGLIDYVCLYCVNPGETITMIKDSSGNIQEINLQKNQGIIIDNKSCLHARKGKIGDRILLRLWIKSL